MTERQHENENSLTNIFNQLFDKQIKAMVFFLAGIFFLALFYGLYLVSAIIVPFVIAVLLDFLLSPAVRLLKKMYIPVHIGAATVIVLLLLLLSFGVYELFQPATAWLNKGPEAVKEVDQKLTHLSNVFAKPFVTFNKISEEISELAQKTPSNKTQLIHTTQSTQPYLLSLVFFTTWQFFAELSIVMILLYFLLVFDNFFLRRIVHWLSSTEKKKEAVIVAHKIQYQIGRYLFARTAINIILAVIVSALLYVFDMPDPILWGVLTGILQYIPYLGAIISSLCIVIIAIFSFTSLAYALFVTTIYSVLLFIEGNLITPYIIGRATLLHPIMIFLGLVFWGWLWGVAGAFIAAPLLVCIKLIVDSVNEKSLVSELLTE